MCPTVAQWKAVWKNNQMNTICCGCRTWSRYSATSSGCGHSLSPTRCKDKVFISLASLMWPKLTSGLTRLKIVSEVVVNIALQTLTLLLRTTSTRPSRNMPAIHSSYLIKMTRMHKATHHQVVIKRFSFPRRLKRRLGGKRIEIKIWFCYIKSIYTF